MISLCGNDPKLILFWNKKKTGIVNIPVFVYKQVENQFFEGIS